MAPRSSILAATLLAILFVSMAYAQTGDNCSGAILSLSSCLDFTTGNAKQPSPSCCSSLAGVVTSEPQCLCTVIGGSGSAQAAFGVNETLALQLPAACNIRTPPASQCGSAVGGPVAFLDATSKPSRPLGGSKSAPPPDDSKANNRVRMPLLLFFTAIVGSSMLAV